MTRALLVVVVLAASPTARAEPAKSENVALGVSFAATLGSMAIAIGALAEPDDLRPLLYVGATGMMLGPMAGHIYARHYVTYGLAIRLLGVGVIAHGVIACHDERDGACPDGTRITIGALVFLAGTIVDFATLPSTVRRRNRELAIGPAFGGRGLAVSGRF